MPEFPDFSRVRALVVGDVMLDRYVFGSTSRISPEAPVPVVSVEHNEDRPGGAANVAANLAALGVQVSLIGLMGSDEGATSLEHQIAASGVDWQGLQSPEVGTIVKTRILSRHQQLIRLDNERPLQQHAVGAILDKARMLINGVDVVVLSDYAKGTLVEVTGLIELCGQCGVPVLVDPKGNDVARYQGATLITPNRSEFEAIQGGACVTEEALFAAAEALRERLALQALLITRSEQGMTLFERDQKPFHLNAHSKEVYDVTGAGDTVIAVLAATLGAGCSMQVATRLANQAAGLVVTKVGTASVSAHELRAVSDFSLAGMDSLIDEESLSSIVKMRQSRGDRVVMTNGCFDVLHAGHVAYLDQARKAGDCLIVALNDDASVSALKGPSRPLNGLAERANVLSALRSVDYVVSFSEDTPERLIVKLAPDILVKGGDYQIEQIAGADSVLGRGGQVLLADFLDGHSTTGLIEKIRDDVSAE